MQTIVPAEVMERKIFLIRGQKIMLDAALAELYDVETRTLIQAVKRNIGRFLPISCFSWIIKRLQL